MAAQPYVIAALITAIPATFTSLAAWASVRSGRKENSDDHKKVQNGLSKLDNRLDVLDNRIEGLDVKIEKTDLRFDAIEDKIERHLGWHRTQAEAELESALRREQKK